MMARGWHGPHHHLGKSVLVDPSGLLNGPEALLRRRGLELALIGENMAAAIAKAKNQRLPPEVNR